MHGKWLFWWIGIGYLKEKIAVGIYIGKLWICVSPPCSCQACDETWELRVHLFCHLLKPKSCILCQQYKFFFTFFSFCFFEFCFASFMEKWMRHVGFFWIFFVMNQSCTQPNRQPSIQTHARVQGKNMRINPFFFFFEKKSMRMNEESIWDPLILLKLKTFY